MVATAEEIVSSLKDLSDDDVYEALGQRRPDQAGFAASREDYIRLGKAYWTKSQTVIRGLVCNNPEFQSALNKDTASVTGFVMVALGANFGQAVLGYLVLMTVRRVLAGWCDTQAA